MAGGRRDDPGHWYLISELAVIVVGRTRVDHGATGVNVALAKIWA
jgi:hypothetical protein